jgi:transcriptional regulator with XRE-family HTH domain
MEVPGNTRLARIAIQTRQLMERHGISEAKQLADLTKGQRVSVSAAALSRWLGAKAAGEGPKTEKLKAVAAAVGETLAQAFPDVASELGSSEITGPEILTLVRHHFGDFHAAVLDAMSRLSDDDCAQVARHAAALARAEHDVLGERPIVAKQRARRGVATDGGNPTKPRR